MTSKQDIIRRQGLARKIETKVRFLEKIVGFVESVTSECGKLLHYTPGSTHTIRELHNFGGFSFHIDMRQSMMGGNNVKVWYHPDRQYEEGLKPVLDIDWQIDPGKYFRLQFDEHLQWQRGIQKIIQRQRSIKEKFNRARKGEPPQQQFFGITRRIHVL